MKKTPLLGAMFLALAVFAGCSSKPASIELAGAAPATLETADAIPLPTTVVKDESGEPLKEQPPVEWSAKPEGIVQIAGGHVSPIRSGETQLTATVKGTPVTFSHALKVQLIDRIQLECESENCRFTPGTRFRIRAQARSGEEILDDVDFEWTSDSRDIVDVRGGGEFEAKKPGATRVQASARGITAQQNVNVISPVDRLIVLCPQPPMAFQAPSGSSGPSSSCVVERGRTLELTAEVRGRGEVMDRRVAWSSTNPMYVNVSSGQVSGVQEGAAIVEARVENLVVTMPVEVRRAVAERCEGPLDERFEINDAEEPSLLACASADSFGCVERGLAKAKKPYTSIALTAAAKRCCCAALPPLASQLEAPSEGDAGPATTEGDAGP